MTMGEDERMKQAREEHIKEMRERDKHAAPAIMGLEEALRNHKEPEALYGLRK